MSPSGEEINRILKLQLRKLRERDRKSKSLKVDDLKIVFEDKHIIVVDKPSGVLCVPSQQEIPSLAQVVFEKCSAHGNMEKINSIDRMVVHRLGMDTSGLVVFAKTMASLRAMNELFRSRRITRQYEALVCGHISEGKEEGSITLPLMRDYQVPPFMRISTEEDQRFLLTLDPSVVGKRLLEAPRASLTRYKVISREELKGLPVTRVRLTAITGRTHQLNVHCAAIGHPIVRDGIYGCNGDALSNGGLDDDVLDALNPDRVSREIEMQIEEANQDLNMCVHAKELSFRHPITGKDVSFTSSPPF